MRSGITGCERSFLSGDLH